MGGNSIQKEMIQVVEAPHTLIKHWVSVLRDENTPSSVFRSAMAELGRLLIYEATRDWLVQSPVGISVAEFINPKEPILVIPILRAGLALAELPDKFADGARILIVDPMLATGGTIIAAIDILKDRGVENTQRKVISAISSPPTLQKLKINFPGRGAF